jgi:hypothetical protein
MAGGLQMIDIQLLEGVLLALAIVVGAAIALALAMTAAGAATARGQTPRGGARRDLPRQPVPDDDNARGTRHDLPRQPVPDDDNARELVLR